MSAIKTFEVDKATVKIFYDEDATDPREWDNAGTMVCFHRRYTLGDGYKHGKGNGLFDSPESFQDWWKENGKGGLLIPLFLYDHSGITMSARPFSCPWDSGQVGWIYATRETILKEWGKGNRVTAKARKLAESCLLDEVKTYDEYLTGSVYGYVAECGGDKDSCWGFFGFEYCIEQATEAAKALSQSQATIERETAIAECVP